MGKGTSPVHTNSIESVWSLFKRSVVGSYHHLSEKHLQSYLDESYLDEMSFRFNKRKENSDTLFISTLRALVKHAIAQIQRPDK
jgi:hypothetical protein